MNYCAYKEYFAKYICRFFVSNSLICQKIDKAIEKSHIKEYHILRKCF